MPSVGTKQLGIKPKHNPLSAPLPPGKGQRRLGWQLGVLHFIGHPVENVLGVGRIAVGKDVMDVRLHQRPISLPRLDRKAAP